MSLERACLIVIGTAALILTGCQIAPPAPPSLGGLEHRGRRYALRDLTDPAYRDASNDPFVRSFDPETTWARNDVPNRLDRRPIWAGIEAR